jgi:hypothetical protein
VPKVAGRQLIPDKLGTAAPTEIVPPVPEAGILWPAAVDAMTFVICTGTELLAPAEILNDAVASAPLPIVVWFTPNTTQVVVPVELPQVTLLPTAVTAKPLATLTLVIDEDG